MLSGVSTSNLFPGRRCIYRTFDLSKGVCERIGIGFLDKTGRRNDIENEAVGYLAVVYVFCGRGTYTDEHGKNWPIGPGCCFLRRPDHRHTTTLDDSTPWQECFLDLGHSLYPVLSACPGFLPRQPVWRPPPLNDLLARLASVACTLDAPSGMSLPDFLTTLLSAARRMCLISSTTSGDGPQTDGASLLEEACRLLDNACNGRDPLPAFCAQHDLDYEAFRKRFQRHLGLSPGRYRLRRRLERACTLLTDQSVPIAAISERLGYCDPQEFSAQFKRHLGQSPKKYRQTHWGVSERGSS